MEGRPIPVTVQIFGILNLIFGSFGVVTAPLLLLGLNQTMQIYEQYGAGSITQFLIRLSLLISPLVSAGLLATGIGLLMKKEWARLGSLGIACFVIATNLVNMILVVATFSRALGGSTNAGAIGGMIGGLIGGIFGLIYPVLTLIFLTRPAVKAALERRS